MSRYISLIVLCSVIVNCNNLQGSFMKNNKVYSHKPYCKKRVEKCKECSSLVTSGYSRTYQTPNEISEIVTKYLYDKERKIAGLGRPYLVGFDEL